MAVISAVAVIAVVFCVVLSVQKNQTQTQSVAAMATAQASVEKLTAERDALQAQLEADKQADAKRDEMVEKLEKKLKTLERKLEKAQATEQELKDQNASLQQQIDLMSAKKTEKTEKTTSVKTQVQKPVKGKVCYLTFDDGPSNVTPQVLATLKKYNVKATFFVVSTDKLEYLKDIKAGGHAIALHCNSHDYSKVYAGESAYLNDLKTISKKVEKMVGVKSMVVRFPGGSSNTVSRSYSSGLMSRLTKLLPQMGYAYFDWNVSSGDAAGGYQSPQKIAGNVLSQANADKICVLMHDGYGKQTTADALPAIIEGLQKKGYSFDVLTPEVSGFKHGVNN